MLKKTLVAAMLAVSLTGCATIMGSPTQTLPISSTPSDADVVITDEAGLAVFAGKTPTSVTLNKSTGRYWGGKSFTVTISKPGFKTQTIPVKASANGWYIAGNFVFGGLIGWFVVDPLSGNMYTLSPEAVTGALPNDAAAPSAKAADGSVSIVMLQDVPASLRDDLVPVR